MTKSDLQRALRPLVKECVRDIIFEEGFLSGIISEVVTGLTAGQVLRETPQHINNPIEEENTRQLAIEQQKTRIDEARRRMADAIGRDAYGGTNLFEGTNPLSRGGSPDASPAPANPLSGYSESDEGVNIDSLFGGVGRNWKKLI